MRNSSKEAKMKIGINATRWMMKMIIIFQLIKLSINLTIKTTRLDLSSPKDGRKLSKRDLIYRNLEAVNNIDNKITEMILNGIIQHFVTSDSKIGDKRDNPYDFIHANDNPSTSNSNHEEKVKVPYLGINSRGQKVNKPEEVMIRWASNQDQSNWKTLEFHLEHVLFVSRILGMDGEFINLNLEGKEWYEYIIELMFNLKKDEFKFFEILTWFSNHLVKEEFLKRLEVFSYLTSKGLSVSINSKSLKPWWTKIQIERWIKRSDWDVNLILKVGDELRLNEPNYSFSTYHKRNEIREKLMNLLDPTGSSKVMIKVKDSSDDSDNLEFVVKKMSTYIPEALAIEGEPYLIGSLYKKRINLLTEVRKSDGSLGIPDENNRFFRLYWITRGVDPELALKSLHSQDQISEQAYVIFNSFDQSSSTGSKSFQLMNLMWTGLHSIHEVLHQVWEKAIRLRPAW